MESVFDSYKDPITVKLSNSELDERLGDLAVKLEEVFGCTVIHLGSENTYKITGTAIINARGCSYYGVTYVPEELADNLMSRVVHARPIYEFAYGKFESL